MNAPLLTHTAVCCHTHGVRLAICATLVQRVESAVCSPPPSWAQPWIGGLCWMDDDLLVVIDPSGVLATTHASQRPLLVVMNGPAHLPRWALAVESAQAHVPVQRRHAAFQRPRAWPCPQEWLQTASDAAGRSLAWLDVARVAQRLTNGYRTLSVN